MLKEWKIFFKSSTNKIAFILTVIILTLIMVFFTHFLNYIEARPGYQFSDPIVNFFSPINLSLSIFAVTYFSTIVGILISLKQPHLFFKLLQAYTIMTILRIFCLYFTPLEPPVDIIPLKDPVLSSTVYTGKENLKDLFFSGHTATISLFVFMFQKKYLKILFIILLCIVGILLMIQHVHYSIDIIAAVCFGFISVYIMNYFNNKIIINTQ